MAITKRSALTGQAENKNAGAAAKPAQKAPEVQEKKGLWDTLSRHVMTGISNMIPFLIMGGLILAFSQLIPYVILGVDPSMGIVDAMNSGAYEGFNLHCSSSPTCARTSAARCLGSQSPCLRPSWQIPSAASWHFRPVSSAA